jgi:hypothetical protein
MSLETEVASLTTATTNLLNAVTTSKDTLDQAVATAQAKAILAQDAADTATGQANSTFSSALTAQTAAANAVAVTTGGTASLTSSAGRIPIADAAGKIDPGYVDLLAGGVLPLHRSPNAITAMFIYDTSKDSDGGAWTERCQHLSWYQESINGKWLGAHPSELSARCHNAVLGTEKVSNGDFTTDLTGWTASAGASVVSSALNLVTSSATDETCKQTLTTVASTNYVLTFTKVSAPGNATDLSITVGTSDGGSQLLNLASIGALGAGTYSYAFTATTATSFLRFTNATDTAATVIIDSVTVKPVTTQVSTTGDYFQLTTDGKFYSLNAGSGTTQVYRGNKRAFPKLAAIVAEATNLTIYDLTEAGRPMWMRFFGQSGISMVIYSAASCVSALNGIMLVGDSTFDLNRIDFLRDNGNRFGNTNVSAPYKGNIASRNALLGWSAVDSSLGWIASRAINAVAMTVLPDAPTHPATGLKIPTIAVATGGGISIIQNSGVVRSSSSTSAFTQVTLTPQFLSAGRADAVWYYAASPGALGASFALSTKNASTATDFNVGNTTLLRARDRSTLTRTSSAIVQMLRNNEGAIGKGIAATVSDTYNTGWMVGDIRRAYLANSKTADRSYKGATATETGTVTSAVANTSTDLLAYSGFSGSNYIREAYSADLDFGTGEWTCSAWVNIPTGNAAAGTIVCREHSSGAYIRLGINATNKLVATVYDGTTTRTATTSMSYNSATWVKARANYTTDGRVAIAVNGVEVVATTGAALLTLNNGSAVLTMGNSYALDAPFPGSITLLKFSASVPSAEQALFMYEQEKHLFSASAKCVLPASTNVLDMAYDDETDTWATLQATHESTWSGLVRASTQTPSAGSFAKTAAGAGNKLLSRTTVSPGVDVQMPSRVLRRELRRRREAASQDLVAFDFDAVTSQTDFVLPVGYVARVVYSAGAQKRIGSTKDYVLVSDGFRETVRFAVAPGNTVWVQIHAVREVA